MVSSLMLVVFALDAQSGLNPWRYWYISSMVPFFLAVLVVLGSSSLNLVYITHWVYLGIQNVLCDLKNHWKISWNQLWDVPGIHYEAIVDMPVCRKWVSVNWTEANELPEIRTETKVTRASYWEEPNLKLWVDFNESDLHHHIIS